MLNAIFLSDLHLTTLGDPRGQTFLRRLKSWQGPQQARTPPPPPSESKILHNEVLSHLFLVGDIFDLWLADHNYFLETYSLVIDQIRRLKNEGVEIHYFEGNHDLYLKYFWQQNLGLMVHPGPAEFQLGPYLIRVEHGDQMDPEDRGYQFLRWLLRTRVMVKLALHLPSWFVVRLGRGLSESSRQYTSTVKTITTQGTLDKIHRHAELVAAQSPYDFLIHGHVHVQDDYSFVAAGKPRRSINLGSWLGHEQRYLQISDQEIKFVEA